MTRLNAHNWKALCALCIQFSEMSGKSEQAIELKYLRAKIDRHFKNWSAGNVEVRIPKALTQSVIQRIKPPGIKDKILWQGCVFYLVFSILVRTEKKKFKSGKRITGFVSLNHKLVRDVVGPKLTLTIHTLIKHGIIETDDTYVIGGASKGYRLSKLYRKSTFRFVTISEPGIVRRYRAMEQARFTVQIKRLKENAHLIKWFLGNTLKIDEAAARKYLDLYSRRMKRNFHNYGLSKDELFYVNTHLENSVNSCINILNNWDNPRPIIDSKGGRLYTPMTSILSQLRYFTSHEYEEMVYFDIKNSQPFHFLALLNPKFWEKPKKQTEISLQNINQELKEYLMENHGNKYLTTIMMLRANCKSGKTPTSKGLERLSTTSPRFASKVSNGKLYKFISDDFAGKFKKPSGFDPFATKDLAKHELIKMLYFNPKEKHSPSQQYFAEFKKLFPVEAEVIELLKSRRHQDFSVLLQKIESKVLLGRVCKTIFMTDTNIPMYTIHDGVMTTKRYAVVVQQIINKTYLETIGVEPELKIEIINPKTAFNEFNDYITKKTREILRDLGKDLKDTKVKLTLDDIRDLTQSNLFNQNHPSPLSDLFVVMPFIQGQRQCE